MSVTTRVPLNSVVEDGVAVTKNVQDVPGLSVKEVPTQVPPAIRLNTLFTTTLETTSGAVPVELRVIIVAALEVLTFWLPKANELGVRVAAGVPERMPVPVKVTACCDPPVGALSVIVIEPGSDPIVVGENVIVNVHCEPGVRLNPSAGQLFVWLYCPATLI